MKNLLHFAVVVISALLTLGQAWSQGVEPSVPQKAADAIPQLKEKMRDPDSFVLEHVYTAAVPAWKCDGGWCRHRERVSVDAVCLIYRARNGFGGYARSGAAVLPLTVIDAPHSVWKDKDLHLYDSDERGEFHSIIGDEQVKACQPKYSTGEITDQVKAFLAPKPQSAADKAKAAQQYADCLKLAADNPKIVCTAP